MTKIKEITRKEIQEAIETMIAESKYHFSREFSVNSRESEVYTFVYTIVKKEFINIHNDIEDVIDDVICGI